VDGLVMYVSSVEYSGHRENAGGRIHYHELDQNKTFYPYFSFSKIFLASRLL
jgi:hypothetical protein